MIELDRVEVRYAGGTALLPTPQVPALQVPSLTVPEGELVLVAGPTGSGKTSLLRVVADPSLDRSVHGRVLVDGCAVGTLTAVERARVVGYVRQDPAPIGPTVEDEVRRGLALHPVPSTGPARRLEETLDLLDLAGLRERPVGLLSGGQQQRVAIAAALAAGPRVLVLDEPTSALDPVAAEEVLAILHRLVHDVGTTVVVAEHRLERVVHHADSVVVVTDGVATDRQDPAAAMRHSPVFPPLVALGRALGWEPLPLSVREARRTGTALRARLDGAAPGRPEEPLPGGAATRGSPVTGPAVRTRGLGVVRDGVVALRSVSLLVSPGEVVALMGRNGSGKSTLLAALAGRQVPARGRVVVDGEPVLTPQDPGPVLRAPSVAAQLDHSADPDTAQALLDRFAPGVNRQAAPDELSQGQQMGLALATLLAPPGDGAPPPSLVLLDEPTRGLDYRAKEELAATLRKLAASGGAIVLATHDVELAAELASRVVVLAEGEVVADGPAREVLAGSPAFAPQVAKVVAPLPHLTVDEVLTDLVRMTD
ncbi:ATP-binding cassette domain-containing protein [Phycicoccus ginsengisoli]